MKELKHSLSLRDNYFLYIGNAYPHKNLERAVKAVKNLKVKFYIVSSRNVFTKRLEKLIKKLDAGEYVKLLGFVPDDELVDLYKNSLGFLYPSLSEGFGLPGLEAMKNGTILLASDIPVFKEVYGKNAVYFDPLRVESIESAMKKVLEMDMNKLQKMISEAKSFVKRYSWEKMARETLNIYGRLV